MNITRSMHLDFHTLPNIDDFGRDMDYDCIARTLADAGVQYVNSVATCNIGFAYFPTKVGKPYPYMKNDHFGELLKAYRKYGIGVSAYLNIGLNHQHCYENKSWCRVDDKGRIIHGDTTGNFFRSVCYNSDGYRNYLLSIVKEINDNYDVDGFFFDCIKIIPCYCEKCLAEMKTEGVNIKNRREVKKFTYGKILKLCKELKEIISDKEVFFCGLPFNSGLSTHLVVECLPSGNWGYDYFHQASAYARGFYKRPLYMTGRFQADWGDFGGVKNKASFEYDLYDALSNNCDICFGDHLHPRYGLNPAVTDTVKAVYTQAKFYERYTKNTEYLAEIAVLNPSDIFELERPSNVGVVRMLNELKYSYDFIDINADFKKYKLIILPDDIKVDSALKKKLSKYLKSGGKILSTGTSGLNVKGNSFALEEYAFIRFSGFDKNNVPYFVFCEDKDRVEWSCYGSSILMKNLSGKVFGDYLKPYNNRHYDGVHGYFYTPPKEYTEYSVSVCSENICHISFPVFKTYAETFLTAQRKLVKLALETLVKDPLVRAENIPSSIRLTMTRNDEHTLLHVRTTYPERKHLKGVIEEHVLYKGGDKIQVKGNFKKAISVKDNKEIKSQTVGGYTELVLPEVMGYTMIKLIG